MIKLYFNTNSLPKGVEVLYGCDELFDVIFEDDWLDDPLVIEIIKGVDNTIYLGDGKFRGPFIGRISAEDLSGGCKALIMMLKCRPEDLEGTYCYAASIFGDNCLRYILKIQNMVDVSLLLDYCLCDHSLEKEKFNFYDVINQTKVSTYDEYFDLVIDRHKRNLMEESSKNLLTPKTDMSTSFFKL